jgi:hypothetical protein
MEKLDVTANQWDEQAKNGYHVKSCRNLEIKLKSGNPICCAIDIISKEGKRLIAVCSQLAGYTGTSITNAAEVIRYFLLTKKIIDEDTRWIEHYPQGSSIVPGQYTLMEVSFLDNDPSWDALMTWKGAAQRYRVPVEVLAASYPAEIK